MKDLWEDQEPFSTDIPVIDEQHRMMSDIINLLSIAIKKNKNRENILKLLKGYMDYGIRHRAMEEDMMKRSEYPDISTHIRDHLEIRGKMEELYRQLADDKLIFSREIGRCIKKLHDNHVGVHDRAMALYLGEKGSGCARI